MSWLDDIVTATNFDPAQKKRQIAASRMAPVERPAVRNYEADALRVQMALITAELELLRAKLAPPPPPPFPIRALRHRVQVIGLISDIR